MDKYGALGYSESTAFMFAALLCFLSETQKVIMAMRGKMQWS